MKPADFFIGVRQFFGVWIPGLVWVTTISLAVGKRDPIESLDEYSWREIAAGVLFAYLVALAVRGLSFRIGLVISYWFDCAASRIVVPITKWRIFTEPFGSPLLASNPSARPSPVQRLACAHMESALVRADFAPTKIRVLDSDSDEITQMALLGPERLAQRTEDTQAEVDLYASLLLPLMSLCVALIVYWSSDHQPESFFGERHWHVWIFGVGLFFCGLAYKTQVRRNAEQNDWYLMTIAVAAARELNRGGGGRPEHGRTRLWCPLCGFADTHPFAERRGSRYWRCGTCRLVFLDPAQRPDAEAERAHYGTHENDPDDPGYRAFLARLADPLAARLAPGAEGLDYGAGPGPALPRMLEERGFHVRAYDPFFAPDEDALRRTYDFIACSETAEHFHHPAAELARLDGLLRPGGWLGVMTEMLDDARDFATWRYARDPTHVCFYHADTLRWIADFHGWRMETPARNVVLFRKPAAPAERDGGLGAS